MRVHPARAMCATTPRLPVAAAALAARATWARGVQNARPMRNSIVVGVVFVLAAACGKVVTPQDVDAGGDVVDAAPATVDAAVPMLTIDPVAVEFGGVAVGASRTISEIAIVNASSTTHPAFTPRLEGADAATFAIAQSTCTRALAPGDRCTLALVATPPRIGALAAALVVGTEAPTMAALTVTGLDAGGLEIAPGGHAFGRLGLGLTADLPFAITNHGAGVLPAPTGTISGAADFRVTASTCSAALQPGDACTVTASFQPGQLGARTASLIVTAGTSGVVAELSGEGGATLAVTRTGSGAGTVTGGNIQCGAVCAQEATTSSVMLTAAAATGSDFGGWAGHAAVCGGATTCAVPIDVAAVQVEARFVDRPDLNLVVVNPPDTAGAVRVSDPVDQCTDACAYEYLGPTTVTLTAQAGLSTCSKFDHWEGGCAGTIGSCTVSVAVDTSVTAVFRHLAGCTPS